MDDDAKIKDRILKYLYIKELAIVVLMRMDLKLEYHTLHALCKQMADSGHIEIIGNSPIDMHFKITSPGKHFYETSSYESLERKRINSSVWKIIQKGYNCYNRSSYSVSWHKDMRNHRQD